MAKNMDFALLLEVYENMLTDKQRDVMELYYWEDLSLGEIAESGGITRQAVRDSIKRSEQSLSELENKLGFAERILRARENSDLIAALADESEELEQNSIVKEKLRKIRDTALQNREIF